MNLIGNLKWYWIAITNETLPVGHRAQGAMLIEASSEDDAMWRVGMTGHVSDVETFLIGEIDAKHGEPPIGAMYRRLTNEEAAELAQSWLGGVATADDIKAAMSDDDARPGDPLFPGRAR